MATSFSLQVGFPWVNGSIASSTALNEAVNLATFSSTTSSIIIGFDSSANPSDIPYSFQISNGLVHNTGTSWHTTPHGITIGDSATSCMAVVGQSTSTALTVTWNYNATASSASATIGTISNANPLNIQGSVTNLNSPSGTVVTNGITCDRQIAAISTLGYSSTLTLSFVSGNSLQVVSISGPLTLAATGYSAGAQITLAILNASSSSQTLTMDSGWMFLGAAAPGVLAGNKVGVLSLTPLSTTNTSTIAAYSAQT